MLAKPARAAELAAERLDEEGEEDEDSSDEGDAAPASKEPPVPVKVAESARACNYSSCKQVQILRKHAKFGCSCVGSLILAVNSPLYTSI